MQLADLQAKVQELADDVVVLQGQILTMQNSVTLEIARVEQVIAALKSGTIDPNDLPPLTAILQTAVDNLKTMQGSVASAQAQLDGEQPAPPPAQTPAPTPGA